MLIRGLKRIWCLFFHHRPIRKKKVSGWRGGWTECGRCGMLMVRGYYGWQRANKVEVAYFDRRLAKEEAARAHEEENMHAETGETEPVVAVTSDQPA